MKPLYLCVPILKRYDLFEELVDSLRESTVQPEAICVINNGRRPLFELFAMVKDYHLRVHTPVRPLGVAESWNWFIEHVPEDRVISNDDLTFAPRSLEALQSAEADVVTMQGGGFSCFLLRDSCVQKVGKFDETISPGYGYYEDCDYQERIKQRSDVVWLDVPTEIKHVNSATWTSGTPAEVAEHWRRFGIAKENFKRKWPEAHV